MSSENMITDYRNGVLGFIFLLVLSIVIFHYSKESCPEGSFACSALGDCVPKALVCDGNIDCPNSADENPLVCAEQSGDTNMAHGFINITVNTTWDIFKRVNECEIEQIPQGCRCKYFLRLYCPEFELNFVSGNISSDESYLILTNQSIMRLSADSFDAYPYLIAIHLDGNKLTYIPQGIFKSQVRNLKKLYLRYNNLTYLSKGVLSGLVKLQWLFLDYNQLEYIYLEDFRDLVSLEWLTLSHNRLTFHGQSFPAMPSLFELFIDSNEMTAVEKNTFSNLSSIYLLSLKGNKIEKIDEDAFTNMKELKELVLRRNNIYDLPSRLFGSLKNLSRMYIGQNPFDSIPNDTFKNLHNLAYLNIEEVEIKNIETSMFSELENLESIYFKKYSYCLYVSSVPTCRPLSDGISSNNQLLYKPIFRYTNWIICFTTCAGNIMVLFGRYIFRDENRVLSLIIKNLAVSDFLMGIYLLLIGIQDMKYRNIYYTEAQDWISSWSCTVTGMIAMVSSEVSVLLLMFMSVDRFLLIAIPYGRYSPLTMREATFALIFIWSFGIILAIFPVISYLSSTRFYGVNGLCFPLHIDDPYLVGWEYSAVIFFGINATSLIIIIFVYLGMFVSIWKTRNATTLPINDYQFAIRFFFIVLTDVTCWLPIITVKAAAILGARISDDLYGWLVVFILPINSALNPILYTFTTPKYRTQIIKKVPILIKEVASVNKNNGNKSCDEDSDNFKLAYGSGGNLNSNVKIVVNKF